MAGTFFASLLGKKVLTTSWSCSSAPNNMDRIAIPNHNPGADLNNETSFCECSRLTNFLKGRRDFDCAYNSQVIIYMRIESKRVKNVKAKAAPRGTKSSLINSEEGCFITHKS